MNAPATLALQKEIQEYETDLKIQEAILFDMRLIKHDVETKLKDQSQKVETIRVHLDELKKT